MHAAAHQLSSIITRAAISTLLTLGMISFAAAQTASNAPSNLGGRYVAGDKSTSSRTTAKTSGASSRYVSGKQSSDNATPAKPTNVEPTRYVTGTQPGQTAQKARGPVSGTLALIKQALPDIASLYSKPANDADVAALKTFYDSRYSAPIWVDDSGYTPNAKAVIAEIKNADNWGLAAKAFDLPQSLSLSSSKQDAANAELKISLSVLKYVRHARGGRINPRSISRRFDLDRQFIEAQSVLSQIETANEPDAYLRKQHPTHAQFAMLQKALVALRNPKKAAPAPKIKPEIKQIRLPEGPTLRPGMTHTDIGLLRKRLKVSDNGDDNNLYDTDLKQAVKTFQRKNGLSADAIVGPSTRRALNGQPKKSRPANKNARIQKIVINMERWRWMPREPGSFYVLNNIPEYRTRVYDGEKIVYFEKIIVGKLKNPTPAFSAEMKLVVFRPSWGVPNGIKKTEILPFLKQPTGFFGWGGADTRILKQHNLRVTRNGRPVDASKVNWSKVDIRQYTFIQPPSSTNVLGRVKFRFPNRHDVYMHDTPERHLFKQTRRALSHGCIRVQKPRRLAEIILAHDKGWSTEKVGGYWSRGGTVSLSEEIPVHTGYFTAFADENGRVRTFSDLYGFDGRTARALGKTPLSSRPDAIASSSNDQPRTTRRHKKPKKTKKKKSGPPETVAEIMANVFSP